MLVATARSRQGAEREMNATLLPDDLATPAGKRA